jgi:hypothetical protein
MAMAGLRSLPICKSVHNHFGQKFGPIHNLFTENNLWHQPNEELTWGFRVGVAKIAYVMVTIPASIRSVRDASQKRR